MRTLIEIIEECKNGGIPSIDEMRLAICAMSGLSSFDTSALRKLYEAETENKKPILTYSAKFQAEESHSRWHKALNVTPREYLGESFDPDNTEVQKRRKIALKIFEKACNGTLKK